MATAKEVGEKLKEKLGSRIVAKGSEVKIDAVSTGSLALDLATGVDGFPRGFMTELFGKEGGGKCLTADTHVWAEHGLVTIEELFQEYGEETYRANRTTPYQAKLVNARGWMETTSHFTWNYVRPVYEVKTSLGQKVKGTANHPLRVINKNGWLVWRKIQDLKPGDWLAVPRGMDQFPIWDQVNTDEATWLGYIIADGCLTQENKTMFSNSDPDVVDEFRKLTGKLFAMSIISYRQKNSKGVDHHINSKSFRQQLAEQYDLGFVAAAGKEIPLCIRKSSRDVQVAFLRAYMELESTVQAHRRRISVCSASETLLAQVQMVLLNLGIVGRISLKPVDGTDYWRLQIDGVDYDRYLETVGYATTARQEQLLPKASTAYNTNNDSIPHLSKMLCAIRDDTESDRNLNEILEPKCLRGEVGVTYDRLDKILFALAQRNHGITAARIMDYLHDLQMQNYFFARVESITPQGAQPTFDVVMPVTHSFIANGIASHNTSLMLTSCIRNAMNGGFSVFIDAENRVYPGRVLELGMDDDRLFVIQPNTKTDTMSVMEDTLLPLSEADDGAMILFRPYTGTLAWDVIRMLLRENAADVIGIDSVHALATGVEKDAKAEDHHIGVLARLMSQNIKAIVSDLGLSNTALVFVNQIREKIGVMYGNPETTPSGRAIKFYSSMRLKVRVIQVLKKGSEKYGVRVKARIEKSSLARPYLEAEFDIDWDNGIVPAADALNAGKDSGIVSTAGGYYKFRGEPIAGKDEDGNMIRGYDHALAALKENPGLVEEIRQAVLNPQVNEKTGEIAA